MELFEQRPVFCFYRAGNLPATSNVELQLLINIAESRTVLARKKLTDNEDNLVTAGIEAPSLNFQVMCTLSNLSEKANVVSPYIWNVTVLTPTSPGA